jgi:hypothetical protein
MEKKTPTRDFKDTDYYEQYVEMINSYNTKLITSILSQQWIDNDQKYTRWDVLKEVLKFVNGDMKEFKDLKQLNPNREMLDEDEIKKLVEEQARNLGIN